MIERRTNARRTAYVPAKLYFDRDDAGHHCMIVNVSDEGFGVEVEFLDLPPHDTQKDVTLKLVTGEVVTATRQWLNDRRIGLKLSGRTKLGGSWDD